MKIVLAIVAIIIVIGVGTTVCVTWNNDEVPDTTSTNGPPLTASQKIDLLSDRLDDLIAQMQTYEYTISQLQKSLDAAYARIAQLEGQ